MNDSGAVVLPVEPLTSFGVVLECEELILKVGGVELKANLPSLENIGEITINGMKFVRYKDE